MAQPNSDIEMEQQGDNIFPELEKLFFKYLSYWKWILLSLLVFLFFGACYLFFTPSKYEVTASILIKDDKKLGGAANSVLDELDLFSAKKNVDNELEILRSYTLMEEVVKKLNLQTSYSVQNGLRTQQLYQTVPVKVELVTPSPETYEQTLAVQFAGDRLLVNGESYPHNSLITGSFGAIRTTVNEELLAQWDSTQVLNVAFTPLKVITTHLRKMVNAEVTGKNTSVIALSLKSPLPQQGEDMLNTLIMVYNRAAVTDKNALAAATISFIDDRLELLSIDLQDAEKRVEDYKTQQKITNIGTEAQLFLQSVQKNDLELNAVGIQLDVLQQIEQYVLSNSGGGTTPATLGVSDPTLLSLIASLTAAETERTRALHTMKPANPMLQALNDQITALKRNIVDNIAVLRGSLQVTQRKLQDENRRLEALIRSMPKKERELVDVTRQKEIKNQLYVYLLSKREETAIAYAATVPDSRLIDAARSSLGPVAPSRNKILLLFAFMGLALPIGIIWLLDQLNNEITLKDEVEKKLKTPIVGELSFLEQATKLLSVDSRSKYAEEVRTLRTNLRFMQAGGGVQTILITSSISGEGKSLLSANLGVSLAALGKKTVVLGFDLRKPGLHKVFGVNNDEGLSDYLAGQSTLPQVLHNQSENLDMISCGHVAPNPQELLQGKMLQPLFDELRKQYDYVVIDTPPIGLVSDAALLAQYADVSLYVMRQNYTPKDRVRFLNEIYASGKIKNLGVVMNGVKFERWHGYYYSYNSYKYYDRYYGKYYGSDHEAGAKA